MVSDHLILIPHPVVAEVEPVPMLSSAIESTVNACRKRQLGEGEDRKLILSAVSNPQLATEISNTYGGEVKFGTD